MEYKKFISYNIIGGVIWISLFTFAGYFFGNIPIVQKNFHYVILAIVVLSIVPMIVEYIKNKNINKFV